MRRPEIRYPEACRDLGVSSASKFKYQGQRTHTGTSQNNDILRLVNQPDSIFNRVVLRKLRASRILAGDCNGKKWMIRLVRSTLQESRRCDSKRSTQLLGSDSTLANSLLDKCRLAYLVQPIPENEGFIQSAGIRNSFEPVN